MAFRVLQTDEASGEWVGKRVRRYDIEQKLTLKKSYDAIEKISDLVAPPPPEMKYDVNARPELGASTGLVERNPTPTPSLNPDAPPELDPLPGVPNQAGESLPMETEAPTEPAPSRPLPKDLNQFDDELDAGMDLPEAPKQKPKMPEPEEMDEDSEEESDTFDREPRDRIVFSPYKRAISVTLDSFRNMSGFVVANQAQAVNSGFAVNYAVTFDRNVWANGKTLQDSLAFETGLGYYGRTNFSGTQDSYSISPLKAEIHYQLHPSASFTAFGYVGLQYNLIFASDTTNTTATQANLARSALGGIQHTLGAGFYYNIGPQWYLRGDLGWDRLGIGLAVKW